MLHEKPNESFHWKNKLDELDHLPGEPVQDKTASWKKLHDRLREKPHHNKIIWYWVAAASLILIVGIQWIMVNQKDDQRKHIPEQSSITPEMVKEYPVVNPQKVIIEHEQKAPIAVKNKNAHRTFTNTDLKDIHAVLTADTTKEQLPEIIVNTMNHVDTIAIIAAVPVTKKITGSSYQRIEQILARRNTICQEYFIARFSNQVFKPGWFIRLRSKQELF